MFKILSLIIALLVMPISRAGAENFYVTGEMASHIRYELKQQILTVEGVQQVNLSFVVPPEFSSPTYRQSINEFKLNFNPPPRERKTTTDQRGNQIVTATWTKVPPVIDVNLTFQSENRTGLGPIETSSPFPPVVLDQKIKEYLAATPQVQSDHPKIRELALRLTKDAKTQFDAVQRIISFVVDHLQYVTPPVRYDALYSLESGKGNCQNYSHLSAALLRPLGIPARIVNGITLNQPFDVAWKGGTLTFKMGQGRHSWIEVWFPDLGWAPFDPQNTQLFVSNRFIRVEVGLDNNETKNDGLMRWSQTAQTKESPSLRETINADFSRDKANLKGERQAYGPKNLLLTPEVRAPFLRVASVVPPPPPVTVIDKDKLVFDLPFLFGNLIFPEGVDFAFPHTTKTIGGTQFEMTKSFLVETAEYVTTKLTQYAQMVVLKKAVRLKDVGLALHKFGGEGWLWIDVYQDDEGKPGMPLATSEMLDAEKLPRSAGYKWVDFSFARDNPLLLPGAYWIALGFTGSPIINWFFTYGKPVGPVYGTRYKGVFEEDWSGALNYEFNYRLSGVTTR